LWHKQLILRVFRPQVKERRLVDITPRRPGIWTRWKAVARRAAELQSNVVLGVLYYGLLTPLALFRRPLSNPLSPSSEPPRWEQRQPASHDLPSARRQF
jgi:hypothetical protein